MSAICKAFERTWDVYPVSKALQMGYSGASFYREPTPMFETRNISQLALGSIVIAFIVMAIKFVAWWLTGSVALFSDALESIVNVVAAVIAFFAIRISAKPADKNHQFGHHKAEYFSAVIEGSLIVVAALLIFREAISVIGNPTALKTPALGMAVNGFAGVINWLWASLLIKTGTREKSPALLADGRHIMADVVTTIGVLVGLGFVMLTGWVILDALIAMVVGANVLREGWNVVSSSVDGLMDKAPDQKEVDLIRKTIAANAQGAIEVHDIKVRTAGPVSFIELHLVVDGDMSVAQSHIICDRIESELQKTISGARTTIHVEPDHKRKHDGLEIV